MTNLAIALSALVLIAATPALAQRSGGDAAAAGHSSGTISEQGGVNVGPAGDQRHGRTNTEAGPQTGTSGKNDDNNTPLTGPKRKAADRDPDTGKPERK